MIIEMARVRVIGPLCELERALRLIQDLEILHPIRSDSPGVAQRPRPPAERRTRRHVLAALADIDAVLGTDGALPPSPAAPPAPPELARWARLARHTRRRLERARARLSSLEEERAMLARVDRILSAFGPLASAEHPGTVAFPLVLAGRSADRSSRDLEEALDRVLGSAFTLDRRELDEGSLALLLRVPTSRGPAVERLLATARVEELAVPEAYSRQPLSQATHEIANRLSLLPEEIDAVKEEILTIERSARPVLSVARSVFHDRLAELCALEQAGVTSHAFVLEGWVPASARARFGAALEESFAGRVVVETLERGAFESDDAPVVLSNPAILRPFEAIVSMLPLPRYGSIDPTPFVAFFFPLLFGMILGDIGYGAMLAALAFVLIRKSRPRPVTRGKTRTPRQRQKIHDIGAIAAACALFSTVFGLVYGELFGDLGRRLFGLEPILLDREEALMPSLWLAFAIGGVHILLGLVLGAISKGRHRFREAIGPGMSAILVVLIAIAIFAVIGYLPETFFTPTIIAVIVLFPILVVAEGIIAPIELLATLGNILSYARVMAIGTASVMLAVVANRMMGALGGAAVGALFALLFHLVNFALGLFSPTIHALRLHYVEFFGKFYAPGGSRYQPLGHWRPSTRSSEHPGADRRTSWMRAG